MAIMGLKGGMLGSPLTSQKRLQKAIIGGSTLEPEVIHVGTIDASDDDPDSCSDCAILAEINAAHDA